MLITIEICDDGEGAADVSAKFDPVLTDENRDSPAARIAREMLTAIKTTDVKIVSS